jgi:hypothetical protein
MLLRRFGRHIRNQDWFAVLLDVLVVIIGILVAFQIDRWREVRSERALEVSYVQRLIADVKTDLPNIRKSIFYAEQRLGFAELLMAAVQDSTAATDEPARFLVAVQSAAYTNTPALASYTFEDLRSTGNLGLIRDSQLKESLYGYYGFDQRARQWTQLILAGEQHYFELIAGVTDHEQESWVLQNVSNNDKEPSDSFWQTPLDPQPILAAVERLRSRPDVVDWLPNLRSGQMETLQENQRRLALAESLLQELREYSSHISVH